MKHLILICVLFLSSLAVTACSDEEAARKAVLDAGYTNVEITGYSPFSCSKGDDTCTGFRATGPSGRPVEGAVGCAWVGCGKGCTVRLK